jgi:DNA mismatch repair protein MutS2
LIAVEQELTSAPQLEERSLGFLDWPELLARLAAEARSQRGRDACASLRLSGSAAEARATMAEVAEVAALLRAGRALPGLAFPEVEPSLVAADKEVMLGPEEVRPIAELCEIAGAVRRHFDPQSAQPAAAAPSVPTPLLWSLAAGLEPCRPLANRIRETFDPSGEIRDAVSPELARLRREREALSSRVRSEIEELMRADEYASVLQDQFWTVRGDRYVLPLKASAKSLGLGIVHDTSRTGETVFVEPTVVVGLNNRLKLAELDIHREIQRILEELTRDVARSAPTLRANLELLGRIDVVAAKARLSVGYGGHAMEVCQEAVIELRGAHHPLLALRAARERFQVVDNDVSLTGAPVKVLVVSGPNAGGKTVLLKTLGVSALLARAGMLIPAAPGGRVGFFHSVLADIGDQQSVMGDLSTFSAHLSNVAEILRHGTPRAGGQPGDDGPMLVLLDEIMAGTNPEQGAALARAVAEALADREGLAVITTHYDALKALAEEDARFRNAGMEYDPARLTPTFRLRDGAPGRSYALEIAARMELPPRLLARARELAGGGSVALEQVIATLEARETALARETAALAEARAALEARDEEQRAALVSLARRERELGRHSREAIEASVREGREALRAIVREAQQVGTARAAEQARERLEAAAGEALAAFPAPEPPVAPTAAALQVGARVFVPSLAAEGRVVQPIDSRGRVKVTVGALSVDVAWTELGLPSGVSRGRVREPSQGSRQIDAAELGVAAGGRRPGDSPRAGRGVPPHAAGLPPRADAPGDDTLAHARPAPQNTLDLRGRRADDVIDELVNYLDRAALDGRSPVFVIHGHGTGVLKKIVRDYVIRSPYVRRWIPGGKGQGGDGVIVIELV